MNTEKKAKKPEPIIKYIVDNRGNKIVVKIQPKN